MKQDIAPLRRLFEQARQDTQSRQLWEQRLRNRLSAQGSDPKMVLRGLGRLTTDRALRDLADRVGAEDGATLRDLESATLAWAINHEAPQPPGDFCLNAKQVAAELQHHGVTEAKISRDYAKKQSGQNEHKLEYRVIGRRRAWSAQSVKRALRRLER